MAVPVVLIHGLGGNGDVAGLLGRGPGFGPRPRARGPSFPIDGEKKVARAAEQGRPNVAAQRAAWRVGPPTLNAGRMRLVDETWASANVSPFHGGAQAKGTYARLT
jgi:hypothetical protein